jgi:FkbM family methyltransferase
MQENSAVADIAPILQQINDGWSRLIDELSSRLAGTPAPTELSSQIDDLQQRLAAAENRIDLLMQHIEYSLIKEVDLVKLLGNLYYWFTSDISYQWIGNDPRYVIKNYKMTADDLRPLPVGICHPSEYFGIHSKGETIYEPNLKHPIFAHLWLQDIDFVFLDVGANTGTSAIPAGKFFKQYGRANQIVSFEPGVVGDLVVQSVRVNQLDDLIKIERCAVSNVDAAVVFRSLLGHSESNSVRDFREFYPDLQLAQTKLAPTVRLDTYVKMAGIEVPVFVKIDAEGNDWPVVQGMSGLGADRALVIFFEYMPRYLRNETTPQEILKYLAADYTLISLEAVYGTPLWKYGEVIDPRELAAFAEKVDRSPAGWTDIAAISRSLWDHDDLVERLLSFGAG